MLIVTLHNDSTGDEQIGNYNCRVFINRTLLYEGRVEGHLRHDWRDLIIQWAKQLEEEKRLRP